MPPKAKITRADILQTALDLIRREGGDALNARSIAAALDCSTQPVFSNFSNMEELQKAVLEAGYDYYLRFLQGEAKRSDYPLYKAYGRGYIRFAREEGELFRLLFMRDRRGEELIPAEDFETSVSYIVEACGLSRERARLMHLEIWACVHGIATMVATSFFVPDEDMIDTMLTDVYQALRSRHIQEEDTHGCHSN
jgi:AcrR family transcriptional regulator